MLRDSLILLLDVLHQPATLGLLDMIFLFKFCFVPSSDRFAVRDVFSVGHLSKKEGVGRIMMATLLETQQEGFSETPSSVSSGVMKT